jgi:hypothetical protein
MGPDINILIPYSRQYVGETYKIHEKNIFNIIEHQLILKLVTRLSEGLNVAKIIILSDDLDHIKLVQSKKIFVQPRPLLSENISDRSGLEALGRLEFPNQDFLVVNALFPLISLNTVMQIHNIMATKKINVFLGSSGKSRHVEQGLISPKYEEVIWDFGAVTGFCSKKSINTWEAYSEYATTEVMNVRKTEDIYQIVSTLSLGLT